jgi:hypothetical protein
MNEAMGLLASVIGLILVPVCLVRLILGRADLAALYRAPGGEGWPPGVQEGDCPRWRIAGEPTPGTVGPETAAQLRGAATVEPLATSAGDVATLDPRASCNPHIHVVQPRVAVHARIGLAGQPSR